MIHWEMIAEIVDPLVECPSLNHTQNMIRIARHYRYYRFNFKEFTICC